MNNTPGIKSKLFFEIFTITILSIALTTSPLEVEAQKPAKIYGRVAIIMKSGDVDPAAKKDFVILPFSLYLQNKRITEDADKYAGPEPPGARSSDSMEIKIEKHEKAMQRAKKFDDYREKRILDELQKAKDQGKYFEFRTDFDGSYEVVIPPGSWYICSQYIVKQGFAVSIGTTTIVWSVPITVTAGQTFKVDLENRNASYISFKE